MAAWAGLGYYARARNLHRCAQTVCETHAGAFPDTEEALVTLPGIGPYTAAALRCFADEEPLLPVDTNVARVLARRFPSDSGSYTSGKDDFCRAIERKAELWLSDVGGERG